MNESSQTDTPVPYSLTEAGLAQAAPTAGEIIATNIARELERIGWDFEHLAQTSGIPWGTLVSYRADAGAMTMSEWAAVAFALGVQPHELVQDNFTVDREVPETTDLEADVDALRRVLDLMDNFADNDQRARYLLTCNWMRDRLARRQDDAELIDALYLRLKGARA